MIIGLTGGTGFIGQSIVKYADESYTFKIIARNEKDTLIQKENVSYYFNKKYTREFIRDSFEDCDCVVHLGAGRSNPERELSFLNYFPNIEFSENLFTVCNEIGIRNIVNISSTAVYDNTMCTPYKESDANAPLSNYGVSKLCVENMAHIYNKRKNMYIKSLRLGQLIGLGEHQGIVKVFFDQSIKGEKLMVVGQGKAGKEYIYIKDVVNAILLAAEKREQTGIYNIGTGVLTSNKELAETFCNIFGNSGSYELVQDKPEIITDTRMDVSKAEKELGFHARYSIKEALDDMKKEYAAEKNT